MFVHLVSLHRNMAVSKQKSKRYQQIAMSRLANIRNDSGIIYDTKFSLVFVFYIFYTDEKDGPSSLQKDSDQLPSRCYQSKVVNNTLYSVKNKCVNTDLIEHYEMSLLRQRIMQFLTTSCEEEMIISRTHLAGKSKWKEIKGQTPRRWIAEVIWIYLSE